MYTIVDILGGGLTWHQSWHCQAWATLFGRRSQMGRTAGAGSPKFEVGDTNIDVRSPKFLLVMCMHLWIWYCDIMV